MDRTLDLRLETCVHCAQCRRFGNVVKEIIKIKLCRFVNVTEVDAAKQQLIVLFSHSFLVSRHSLDERETARVSTSPHA
jgi:hypothetical protein